MAVTQQPLHELTGAGCAEPTVINGLSSLYESLESSWAWTKGLPPNT